MTRADGIPPCAGIKRWGGRTVVDYALLFVMVLPNLVWILLDRGRWISDTSLYGLQATRLHHTLFHDTSNWWAAMLAVSPKPPILPWVGQIFVAVGRLIGNIDIALLLIIFAAQCAGLLFLYKALRTALHQRPLAILGCLVVASAPMAIVLSTQFYVQTAQLLAVCWFLYIMVSSKAWDSLLTILHLGAASALAMLTIISSPAFCAIPGLIALRHAWANRSIEIRLRGAHAVMFAIAVAFTAPATAWYLKNFDDAYAWGQFGASFIYGADVRNVYLLKLAQWMRYVLYGFAFSAFVALLLPWALAIHWKRNRRRGAEATTILLLVLQIALVLFIVAATAQQSFRYLLPLVAYFAVVGSWSLSEIDNRWLRRAAVVALAVQLVAVNVALYLWDDRVLSRNRQRYIAALEAITQAVAHDSSDTVWLGIGELGVYAADAAYHASKSPDYYPDRAPQYRSIEIGLTTTEIDGDVEALWKQIEGSRGAQIVLMRPAGVGEGYHHEMWQTVLRGAVEISNRVRKSPKFEKVATPDSWELEIYRNVGGT
jgi:hypothetical protein